jgi:hypothetical protein
MPKATLNVTIFILMFGLVSVVRKTIKDCTLASGFIVHGGVKQAFQFLESPLLCLAFCFFGFC